MKLLHFTAEWCGPCKMMKPIINEVLVERPSLEYVVVDIDANRETAIDYGVMSVPTFILLDDLDGIVSTVTGAKPKQALLDGLQIV